MLNFGGWLNSPSWYGHQFPGVFAFFGQLTSVAGIDPFQIMKYYPVALSLLIALFVYSITRMYAPSYASPATGLLLGGLWFQLHISPQSLELLLYLGFLYLMLRVLDDRSLRLQWTALAVSAIPIFVASHPETPLAVGLGISLSLVLSILQSRRNARMILSRIWLPFSFLVYVAFIWWTTIATAAGALVVQTILARALLSLSQLPVGISTQTSSVPSTPAFSYLVTILLEQASSVAVWILGFTLMILLRKMRARELLFGGLFLAAVSTIPLAIHPHGLALGTRSCPHSSREVTATSVQSSPSHSPNRILSGHPCEPIWCRSLSVHQWFFALCCKRCDHPRSALSSFSAP